MKEATTEPKLNGGLVKRFKADVAKFTSTKQMLNTKTQALYSNVILKFLKYSPDLHPKDLELFISTQFPKYCKSEGGKLYLSSTAIKYCSIIQQYFSYKGIKAKIKAHKNYRKKATKVKPAPAPKMSHSDVYQSYSQLVCKGFTEDAVILHIIYNLGLDPYNIYTLRFDDICPNLTIRCWDYRSSAFKEHRLDIDLNSDLNFLKIYIKNKHGGLRKLNRTALDGAKISGFFVTQLSPSGIYSRFKRRFSGVLQGDAFTPKDVIDCAKMTSEERGFPKPKLMLTQWHN